MNNFLKAGLMAMTACAATTSFADNSEGLQLAQVSDGFNAEQKYMASCFACHSTGAAGAPKVGAGMMSEWEPRLEKGLDAVVANAINGVNRCLPRVCASTATKMISARWLSTCSKPASKRYACQKMGSVEPIFCA